MKKIGLLSILTALYLYADAQVLDTNAWTPNGPVFVVQRNGTKLYIGGSFTDVGPVTGSAVPISFATGSVVQPFAKVDGEVNAVEPDSSGGWFIGGLFSRVNNWPCSNFAHLNANGSVDTLWNYKFDNRVRCLHRAYGNLYVGGDFNLINTAVSGYFYLVSINDTDRTINPVWAPAPNNSVYDVTSSNGLIYVAGNFTAIGGAARNRIARLDTVTGGILIPTFPYLDFNFSANALVRTICVDDTLAFAGGDFLSINLSSRAHFAAFGLGGYGTLKSSIASFNGNVNVIRTHADTVFGPVPDVFVGGDFTTVNNVYYAHLCSVSKSNFSVNAWNPDVDGPVHAITVSHQYVIVGGAFGTAGGNSRKNIAAFSQNVNSSLSWAPHVGGPVEALAYSFLFPDSCVNVMAGGNFISVGGVDRSNLAAIDLVTGMADPLFKPDVNNTVVSMAFTGNTILFGGDFSKVNGITRDHFCQMNLGTNLVTAYDPAPDGQVRCIVPAGDKIYLGGNFNNVGGQSRSFTACIDAATGNALGWNPKLNGTVNSLIASGEKIYAGGYFTVASLFPRLRAIALDTIAGIPLAWNPAANDGIYSLEKYNDKVFAGGWFTSIGGQGRKNLASVDSANGNALSWNPDPNSFTRMLKVQGDTLFAAGNFTTVFGNARERLCSFDLSTGSLTAWHPVMNNTVYCLDVSGKTVYNGGIFSNVNGHYHPYLAIFDNSLATGIAQTSAPRAEQLLVYPNPADNFIQITCSGKATLAIYNSLGEKVLERSASPGVNTIEIAGLKSGTYFVHLASQSKAYYSIFIKR